MPRLPVLRRAALTTAGLALALAGLRCASHPGGKPPRRAKQRVFVIGFDGMDPTLARKYMDEGKLPNLKRLAESGTFATLGSTQPSESPTAWSSFATLAGRLPAAQMPNQILLVEFTRRLRRRFPG